MPLPREYEWLDKEMAQYGGPLMVREGLKLFGITETPGAADNKTILEWAKEVGVDNVYKHDSVPWCGLFLALVAKRGGHPWLGEPKDTLWALSWLRYGKITLRGMFGDVLIFKREGGGHVALYIGEDVETYHVLGGNQTDKINIIRINKTRCVGIRRPLYKNTPQNVRRIVLEASGMVSTNEA